MSMSEFISLAADDDSIGSATAAQALDVDSIESETRRLLNLDADEGSHPGDGEGEGGQAVHPPGDAVSPPPTSDPAPADAPVDEVPAPTLSAPAGADTDTPIEDNFIVVEPGEVIEGVTDIAPATPESPAPSTGYDYNRFLEAYFGELPEPAAVTQIFSTWNDLNSLPPDQQAMINDMLRGTFQYPQAQPTPSPAAPVPAAVPEVDAWGDPIPAPATTPSTPDPHYERLEQQLAQLQLAQASQVQKEVTAGANAAVEELPTRYEFLTREDVDSIQIAVNGRSGELYSMYGQGYDPKSAYLSLVDQIIMATPTLRDRYVEAEVARRAAPAVEAITQASARAANAAKVSGGSTGGGSATSPLARGNAASTPELPAQASRSQTAQVIADEIARSGAASFGGQVRDGL